MRSGPATRTALFWRNALLPFHARGAEDFTAGPRSAERWPLMPPGRQLGSKLHNSSAALRWPTASPATRGGLSRRPQRPGNHRRAETRSGGSLPAIHPRELPGSAGSAVTLRQGTQNISLDANTMRSRRFHRKRKAVLICEETVDAYDCLWKALENLEKTCATRAEARGALCTGSATRTKFVTRQAAALTPPLLDNAVQFSAGGRARGE